ncbi:MAG TPA: SpoIVB peptidase S55 domain-containing protein, partial [Kofleriaceae bacterium]
MRGFMRLCAAAGVLLGWVLFAPVATAAPETYPLSKVKRGQTGYGMTTFVGSTPEKFTFEIISVMRNYMPKMDLILVKSSDPKLQLPGVWRGMSGSPLFIDGKLVCAFSYAWSFNKQVMGGCTPIDYMKKEGDTIRRKATFVNGPNGTKIVQQTTASMEDWRRLTPRVDAAAALEALGPAKKSWLLSAPLPPAVKQPAPYEGQAMTASVPLSVAGFSAPAFNALAGVFADSNLTPIRAGGTGGSSAETGPKQFTLGGPISVVLARGDMAMAGTGTVTHIDGNKVLAFGHPMFKAGEIYMPVSTAKVHTVVASAQFPYVLASPGKEVG